MSDLSPISKYVECWMGNSLFGMGGAEFAARHSLARVSSRRA